MAVVVELASVIAAAAPPACAVSVNDGRPGEFVMTVAVDTVPVNFGLKRGSKVLPPAPAQEIKVDFAAVYSILDLSLGSGSELIVTLEEKSPGVRTASDTGAII